jgi:hypothetical protein
VIAVRDVPGRNCAGLANYASAEARLLCRKPSSEFEKLLGYKVGRAGDGAPRQPGEVAIAVLVAGQEAREFGQCHLIDAAFELHHHIQRHPVVVPTPGVELGWLVARRFRSQS